MASLPVPSDSLIQLEPYPMVVGDNRGDEDDFATDIEAINGWLSQYEFSPHTLRSAKREIERLWLWLGTRANRGITALSIPDMADYLSFLANPQPREQWVAEAKFPRGHENWRPFFAKDDGPPLSDTGVRQSITVLTGFFNWLVQAGYLRRSPLRLIRKKAVSVVTKAATTTRYFSLDEWRYIGHALEKLAGDDDSQQDFFIRSRWTLSLLYLAELRISEVTEGTMGDFVSEMHDGQDQWWLRVLGKGRKTRMVAVPPDLLTELVNYRQAIGLPSWPSKDENTPLVVRLRSVPGESALTSSALHKSLRALFERLAVVCEADGKIGLAQKLEQASAHWLRHTGASHLLESGEVSIAEVRDQLGHSSIAVTNTYLHIGKKQRHGNITKASRLGWQKPED